MCKTEQNGWDKHSDVLIPFTFEQSHNEMTTTMVHDLKSINALLVSRVRGFRLAIKQNDTPQIQRNLDDLKTNDEFLKSWITVIMKKNSAGIEGTKGALWWQIDDILREKRPKYVLLENVDRLIRSPAKQFGRDFSIILRCLYEKGYAVEWRVINAADYGYAQRRRRTFIVAYHNQTEIFCDFAEAVCVQGLKSMHKHIMENGILAKAFPVQSHSRSYVESWIDELEYADISTVSRDQRVYLYNAGVMMNGWIYSVDVTSQRVEATSLKDILETGQVDEHYFLRTEDMPRWTYSKGAKREKRQRRDGSQYYFSEGSVQFPESLNKPSRTMLTSESQVGRTSHVVQDPMTGRLRVLTPIECERLNGFPDDWTNTGMPERMRYFRMGNALVVPLVKRIGDALLNAGI